MLHLGARNSTAAGGFSLLLIAVYCYSFLIYISSAASQSPLPVASVMDEDHLRAALGGGKQAFFSVSSPEDVAARVLQHKTRTWRGTATSLELERSTVTTTSPRDLFLRAGEDEQPATSTFLKQETFQLQWNHMSTELYLTLVNTEEKNNKNNKRTFIYRRHGPVQSQVLDVHYLLADPGFTGHLLREGEGVQAGRGGFLPVPFTITVSYGSNPSFLSPLDVRAKMELALAFRGNGFGDGAGRNVEEAASRSFGALGLLTKPRVGSIVREKEVYREQEQFDRRTGARRIVKVLAGIRREVVKFAVLPADLKREVEREQAREQRRRQAALEAGQWGVEPPPAGARVIADDRDERMIGSSASDEEADDEEEEYEEASARLQNNIGREHEHDVLIPRPAAIVFRKLGITPLQGLNRGTLVHHTSPEWTFGPHTVRVWRVAEDVPEVVEVEVVEEQQMKKVAGTPAPPQQERELGLAKKTSAGPGGPILLNDWSPEAGSGWQPVPAVQLPAHSGGLIARLTQAQSSSSSSGSNAQHQLQQAPGSGAVAPPGAREELVEAVDEEEQMKFLEKDLQRLRLDIVNVAAAVDDEEGEKKAKVVKLQPLREVLLAGLPRNDEALLRELQLQWNYSPPEDQGPAGGAPATSAIVPQNGAPDSMDEDLDTKNVLGGIASACVVRGRRGSGLFEGESSSSRCITPPPPASPSTCRAGIEANCLDPHRCLALPAGFANSTLNLHSLPSGASSSSCCCAGAAVLPGLEDLQDDEDLASRVTDKTPFAFYASAGADHVENQLPLPLQHSRHATPLVTPELRPTSEHHRAVSKPTCAGGSHRQIACSMTAAPASGSGEAALDTDELQLLPPSCLPSSSAAIFADCGGRNTPSATFSRAARCATTSCGPREMKGQIEIGVRQGGREHVVNHEDGGGPAAGAHSTALGAGTSSGSILSRCATQLLRASSTAVSGGKMSRRGSKTKVLPFEDRDPAASFSGISPTGVVGEHLLREREGACSGCTNDCDKSGTSAHGLFAAEVAPSLPPSDATRIHQHQEQAQAPAQHPHLVPHQLPGSVSPSDEWTPEMETPEAPEAGQQDQELSQAAKKSRKGRGGFSSLAAKALAAMGGRCGSSAPRRGGRWGPGGGGAASSSCAAAATPAASAAVGAETETQTAWSGQEQQQLQLAEDIEYLKQMHPRLTERYDNLETPGSEDDLGQSDEVITYPFLEDEDPFLEELQSKNDVEDRKREAASWSTETRFVFPAPRMVARPFRHPLVQKLLRRLLSSEVSLSSESGSGVRGRSSRRGRAQSQRRVGGFTFADTFEFTDEVHELARRRKKAPIERLRRRRAAQQGRRGPPRPVGAEDAEPESPAVAAGVHDRRFVNATGTGAHQPLALRAEDFDQELFDPKDVLVLWADFVEDEQGRTQEPVQITRLVHGVPNLMQVAVSTLSRGAGGGGGGGDAGGAAHVEKRVVEMLAPAPWVEEQEHGARRTSRRRRRSEELLRREMEMLLPQPTAEELTQGDAPSEDDDEREVLVICTFGKKVNVGGDVSTTAAPARPTRLLLLAPSTQHFAAQLSWHFASLPNVKDDEAEDSDSSSSAADVDRSDETETQPPRLPDVTWDDDDDEAPAVGARGPGDAFAGPGPRVGQRQDQETDDATLARHQQMTQIGAAGEASASGQPLLAAGGRAAGGQRRRSDVTNSLTLAAPAAAARASSRAQSLPTLQQDLRLPRFSAPRQDEDEHEPVPSGLTQQPPPQEPRPARGSQEETTQTLTFCETRVNAMMDLRAHLPALPAAEILRSILRERVQGRRGPGVGARAGPRGAGEGAVVQQEREESEYADDAMAMDEGEIARVRELVMEEDPYDEHHRNDGRAPGRGPTRPLLGRATF